jgi:hypothetical protein
MFDRCDASALVWHDRTEPKIMLKSPEEYSIDLSNSIAAKLKTIHLRA